MIEIMQLPSDKSISHRAVIFAALLPGRRILRGNNFGADILSTIACFEAFGVVFDVSATEIVVESPGWRRFSQPQRELDAGNSGTTARLLMGICAALPFTATISGDASLSRRPMRRIAEPLRLMGAAIDLSAGDCLPAVVHGRKLHGIEYVLPVASAQLKSALLLAAFVGGVAVTLHELARTRNHTELLLAAIGAELECDGLRIYFKPGSKYHFTDEYVIPGDASSAAYWVVWASIAGDVCLRIHNVNLNPSRIGYISVLRAMGADIVVSNERLVNNEPVGSIVVQSSQLQGVAVEAELIADIIDEVPVLALAAGFADGESCFYAVAELRVKESNRLAAITELLTKIGVSCKVVNDDLHIIGAKRLHGGIIQTYHDHRIAMCAAIASLLIDDCFDIDDYNCIAVSYPNFLVHLRQIMEGSRVIK